MGVRHLGLAGGEPLLRHDILDIIHQARSLGMEISLVTNGGLLTSTTAAALADEQVEVIVSLDGARAETHDRRRGTGSYDRALGGIARLQAAGVVYRTVFAIGTDNYTEAREYLTLSRSLGADSSCFIPVMPAGRAGAGLVPSPPQLADTLRWIAREAKHLKQPVQLWCLPFAPLVDGFFDRSVGYCRTSLSMDIEPVGNVLLCDVLDLTLSSAAEKGLAQAWEEQCASPVVRRLANPRLSAACSTCPLAPRCRGGCFARASLMSGHLDVPDQHGHLRAQAFGERHAGARLAGERHGPDRRYFPYAPG